MDQRREELEARRLYSLLTGEIRELRHAGREKHAEDHHHHEHFGERVSARRARQAGGGRNGAK
jgi:hypothetical protein